MTDRWLNVVLAVVVVVGLAAVTVHERPRAAEERAELLGQQVTAGGGEPAADRPPADGPRVRSDRAEQAPPAATPGTPEGAQAAPGAYGVSTSHPLATEVGMGVLQAGGNAVDAAVAVSYALAVVEPFGSGVGGGGALLLHRPGDEPVGYDYRETAPLTGQVPASQIGVPGFVAGMEHVHERHGSIPLTDLIEPAARLAEDGFVVGEELHGRLLAARGRLPIHHLPWLFPRGEAIAEGELLRQPEHAEVLRVIQRHGSAALYGGELGARVAAAVSGLEPADLEAYEVLEVPPVSGRFAGLDVVAAGPPVSGLTVVQQLQIAEARGVGELAPGTPEHLHVVAQAYRLALADRIEYVADPTAEDVPVAGLLDPDYARALADHIPGDRFAPVDLEEAAITPEADTTHIVVVDGDGAMVSATNTLSNFFGSGLAVSGFFLNDQLKNFARDPESVNAPAPGKRPRSFITPVIVAADGAPVLGLGSPGGRRIPMMIAQVLIGWAAHGQPLEEATATPRFHVEDDQLFVEGGLDRDAADRVALFGYRVNLDQPTTGFYGAIQALHVDRDRDTVDGVADGRRGGRWAGARP